jgi:hypothetical protein
VVSPQSAIGVWPLSNSYAALLKAGGLKNPKSRAEGFNFFKIQNASIMTRHLTWPRESGIPNCDIQITYSTGIEAQFNGGVNLSRYGHLVVSLPDDGSVSHLDEYET